MNYALVTGASSGIGREFARQLAERGYHLILAARREEELNQLADQLKQQHGVHVAVCACDLTREEEVRRLYEFCAEFEVEVLVNNAGFGKLGYFEHIPLEQELDMIRVNVIAPHMLMKLFLSRMTEGYILNVGSMAGYQPNPCFAAYGASKSYLIQLSQAVGYELRRTGSRVSVSVLCPGPVDTEFNQVAEGKFPAKAMTAEEAARIGIEGMLAKKPVIVTGAKMKLCKFAGRILPDSAMVAMEYKIQKKKRGD